MSFLGFSNNYFEKAAVTVQSSFTRDISWKTASVIGTWCTSEEVKMKQGKIVLGYKIIVSRTFFDLRKQRDPGKSVQRHLITNLNLVLVIVYAHSFEIKLVKRWIF